MVRITRKTSSWARSALLLAVAVGLVLPAPARCASCAAGGSDCAKCQAAEDGARISAVRSCCQRHAKHEANAVTSLTDCIKVRAHTCGCRFSPADRMNAPAERQKTVPDVLAALPALPPRLDDAAPRDDNTTAAIGDVSPPVPHRILHCSWII